MLSPFQASTTTQGVLSLLEGLFGGDGLLLELLQAGLEDVALGGSLR